MFTDPLRWACLALFLLAGCSKPTSGPLRVGLVVWPPYEMAFLARDLGYYDGAGIELVDYESPADVLRAYHSGSVDVTAFTLDYGLQAAARSPGQRIILIPDVSLGGDALVARAEVASVADLEGRSVGIESSVLGAYMLTRALAKAGVDGKSISVKHVDIPEQRLAWERGKVDAMVTYEPVRTQLIEAGGHEIFSSRDIPGEVVDIVLTRREVEKAHGPQLERFVRGWLDAVDVYRADPEAMAARVAAREGVEPGKLVQLLQDGVQLNGWEENRAFLSGDEPRIRHAAQTVVKVMRDEGFLERDVALDELWTDAYVRSR